MNKANDYGAKCWMITGEGDNLSLMADRIEVLPCGALVAWGGHRAEDEKETSDPIIVYGISANQWHTFHAASCLDGRMVAEI